MTKRYELIGADGRPYLSEVPGTLGGHRRNKVYGRLDCAGAQRWIAKGHYVKHRVFFKDEPTAIAAGYRPCANCMPEEYRAWTAVHRSPKARQLPSRQMHGRVNDRGNRPPR